MNSRVVRGDRYRASASLGEANRPNGHSKQFEGLEIRSLSAEGEMVITNFVELVRRNQA